MMDKKYLKKSEKLIKEFFKKATIEVDFEVEPGAEEGVIKVCLKTDEPQVLIGKGGSTLADIQQLLGRVLRKQLEEEIYLDLDINQYKESKVQYLKDLAHELADSVSTNKTLKELPSMNSFERRIIHMELADRRDVKTESAGEGIERRVVIKPN